jgi:hypothetical protein
MEQRESRPEQASPPRSLAATPGLGKRVLAMVGVWLLFGVVVGAGSQPGKASMIGVIAGIIAGVMVLPWLGLVLGLMGGRAQETLIGGLWALLVGAAAGLASGAADVLHWASACLVAGGLTGATFPVLYRVLRACLRHAATRAA